MTVPGKQARGRQYVRKFDYEAARVRWKAGESLSALATEYGVSVSRLNQVVNPEIGAKADKLASAYRWKCPDCGADTRSKGRRCNPCSALVLATSVRPDELHCSACDTWKPDENFTLTSWTTNLRRGRKRYCRQCDVKKRQDYRARNYEREQAYWKIYNQRRREAGKR